MSAIFMRTILLLMPAVFASFGVALTGAAAWGQAAAGAGTQVHSASQPLTRDDVDRLLRQAQSAIQRGDFDEANALITRAESARLHYPLFHFGPTPLSVRKELNRAQQKAPASNNVSRGGDLGGGVTDPFLPQRREASNPAAASADSLAVAAAPRGATPARYDAADGSNEPQGPSFMALPDAPSLPGLNQDRYAAAPAFGLGSSRPSPPARAEHGDQFAAGATNTDAMDVVPGIRQAPIASDLDLAQRLPRQVETAIASDGRHASPAAFPGGAELPFADRRPAEPTLPALRTTPPPSDFNLPAMQSAPAAAPATTSLIDATEETQQALARQLSAEVGKRQTEAQRLLQDDPERALVVLREAQQLVDDSKLPEAARRDLLSRIEITLNKTEKYIKDNAHQIELDKQNAAALRALDRDRELRVKVQQRIADGIEEFNRLRDEQRYAEMELVAKRLMEIAPDEPVVKQAYQTAKFIRREFMNRDLARLREENNWNALHDVERSSFANVGEGRELVFDQKHWRDFVKDRKGAKDRNQRRTERELEIERRLKTPVQLRYHETPLAQVVAELSQLADVNIHLDPRGLQQEGVGSDTPVSLDLNKEISLASALNLILEQFHLSYVIKDDVLKITSQQLRNGEIYAETYSVADLVIPIPNFVPSSDIGLQGSIDKGYDTARYSQYGLTGGGPMVTVSDHPRRRGGGASNNVLAQQFGAAPGGLMTGNVPVGGGPGGMGGGAMADFDSLIDLIISTVATETWAENGGGEAEIRPFPTNLSLVISQTQAVHEEIADLLEQLRRLQDLQVTIEVRFIRLNDDFFERIGIDFQANIVDRGLIGATPVRGGVDVPGRGVNSGTVGLFPPAFPNPAFPNFTADLDIPFRQGSFSAATPAFGGFDPATAANFGFAILSDIEAFFLIEAAQGDSRTNVLQAPKVTLFNGQQAFVGDFTQRPFVVGVIPVVGEFAAAQQPVIVVLNEGTMMTMQAVVSDDRRYVRMTIVPFFTQIGRVDEFTFEGSSSSTSSSASDDDDDGNERSRTRSQSSARSGVTVQLPAFSTVTVVTTVSVPDGGTVLLGGIKRLSEGRSEFGVPLLSKVPYINRLFRNVAIGRTTESLMMMVTPRIIIQEEEEERMGIAVP